MEFGGVQLFGTGHRQHGSSAPLWHSKPESPLARSTDDGNDALRIPHDRTRGGVLGCHQHRDQDRARRRQLRAQRTKMVVIGRRRSAMRCGHRHGQDRRHGPPALPAIDGACADECAGYGHRAHAAGVRIRRCAPWARGSAVEERAYSGRSYAARRRAAASRSRRVASVRGEFITACGRSEWPKRRSKR
jgi:hypothetical protein